MKPSFAEATEPTATPLDATLWRTLLDPETQRTDFANAWLGLQCGLLPSVRSAVLVTGPADTGPFAPIAYWPSAQAGSAGLAHAAEIALGERRPVLRAADAKADATDTSSHIALPLLIDQAICGVIAVELPRHDEADARQTLRLLQWGVGRLEARWRRDAAQASGPTDFRSMPVLQLLATGLDKQGFQDAASALITETAVLLECERAAIGFRDGKHMRVRAISHSAQFAKQSNLLECLGEAMDEAADFHGTVRFPPPREAATPAAHAKLARSFGSSQIVSLPFGRDADTIGVIVLERPADRPFDDTTIAVGESIAALAGPLLELKRQAQRGWLKTLADELRAATATIAGPGHAGAKLGLGLGLLALIFLIFATGTYRVTADTRIEGEIQRVVAAPRDGFIFSTSVRAGDTVREGDPMLQLDDRPLQLERQKWDSQREQYLRQYRDALAKSGRAEIAVLQAQIDQAEAELALIDEQLAKSRIAAPFDGIVVSGDLSQSHGAPVGRGDVLYEVAPLNAYRVVLEVDEADMREVRVGQTGKLVLTGESASVLDFAVNKLTPVAEAREGRNFFRVEARLQQTPDFLRPGMKGVAKVEIGSRRLVWIWTHRLFDWWRLWLWNYLP